MENKKKWFIRVTSIDKANGPIHNMMTTHTSYSHAATHLKNVIGAEKGSSGRFSKGKLQFDIIPMQKHTPQQIKKNIRTESLMEDDDKKLEKRNKNQIVNDAVKRAKEKIGLKNLDGGKTSIGGVANKIDMDPELEQGSLHQDGRPIVNPSPGNKQSN